MKLLFDQNLSYRLVSGLKDLFPESLHVKDLGFESAGDEVIWSYAQNNGYCIVSKDSDFRHLSFLFGAPPKVISIRKGEVSTDSALKMLKSKAKRIGLFLEDDNEALLILD